MTSQQLGDLALEEHRAVMAALIRNEINRPTENQYLEMLRCVTEEMSHRPIFLSDLPERLSSAF
jgi:hypothetical protein